MPQTSERGRSSVDARDVPREHGGTTMERIADIRRRLEHMAEDQTVRTGGEAALRTVINAAITVADMVPGVGTLASWGADAAKIWARLRYAEERRRVAEAGGDPDTVKLSPVDLTPDVSVAVAVWTELLEFISLDFLPTHAIEAGMQLSHDLPRMRAGLERARAIAVTQSTVADEEQEALETFGKRVIDGPMERVERSQKTTS